MDQPVGQPVHFTNVIVSQPSADNKVLVAPLDGHRNWSSELFGCCEDVASACKAMCCFECMVCGLNTRVGECACAHWIVPGALINLRTRIRTLGGIRGSMVNDCCVMAFCPLCAVCQMERELDYMGL